MNSTVSELLLEKSHEELLEIAKENVAEMSTTQLRTLCYAMATGAFLTETHTPELKKLAESLEVAGIGRIGGDTWKQVWSVVYIMTAHKMLSRKSQQRKI